MRSLRGLLPAATAVAAMMPGVALAHPGHGLQAGHSHTEWLVAAVVAAVIGGVTYIARRNSAE